MPDWVLWMIAAGVLAVGEIFTLSFFLGPIAVAALVTAGVAALGVGVALQIIVFALVSIATVAVLRPVARRHLRTPCSAAQRHRRAGGGVRPWCSNGWTATPGRSSCAARRGARVHSTTTRYSSRALACR